MQFRKRINGEVVNIGFWFALVSAAGMCTAACASADEAAVEPVSSRSHRVIGGVTDHDGFHPYVG